MTAEGLVDLINRHGGIAIGTAGGNPAIPSCSLSEGTAQVHRVTYNTTVIKGAHETIASWKHPFKKLPSQTNPALTLYFTWRNVYTFKPNATCVDLIILIANTRDGFSCPHIIAQLEATERTLAIERMVHAYLDMSSSFIQDYPIDMDATPMIFTTTMC